MTQDSSFDFKYRPDTYWPGSETREQRLSHIQGKARRDITRKALEEGGIEALNIIGAEVATETLSEDNRQAWGSIHPSLMGGEYLPDYEESDVEIARISLESVTADQVCVLASGVCGASTLAVEPVSATAVALQANIDLNGLDDRVCLVVSALTFMRVISMHFPSMKVLLYVRPSIIFITPSTTSTCLAVVIMVNR